MVVKLGRLKRAGYVSTVNGSGIDNVIAVIHISIIIRFVCHILRLNGDAIACHRSNETQTSVKIFTYTLVFCKIYPHNKVLEDSHWKNLMK